MKRSGLLAGFVVLCALAVAVWAGEKAKKGAFGDLGDKIGKTADDTAKATGKVADDAGKEAGKATETAAGEMDKGRKAADDRWRQMREQRMTQIREAIGPVSDEQWAKIQPLVDKLDQYARVREMLGRLAMMRPRAPEGGKAPEMNVDRMVEHVTAGCPNAEKGLVTELAAACKALADTVADKNKSDEEVKKASEQVRAACAKLDAKADETRTQLAGLLTARQQAALLLQGVLK